MAFAIARYLTIPLLRWRVASAEGLDIIPRTGPAILVANHVGQQDPLLLTYAIVRATGGRAPHTIAKWKIFHSALSQRWLKTIPLYANRQRTVDQAMALLKRGELVLVYPEARINSLPTISKVKTGAARLALSTHVPIIPIGLQRTSVPPKHSLAHAFDLAYGRVHIRVGQPVDVSEWYNTPIDRPLLNTVMGKIMQSVATLGNKTYTA